MNPIKRATITVLLRLYPRRWRQEYAEELSAILSAKTLGPAAVFDVIFSALGQQLRIGEPWMIVGMPLLLLNLTLLLWNILNPWVFADDTLQASASLAQRLWFWLPALTVGCWTVLRNPAHGHGGRAAMKSAFLTSWPVSVIAILAALGILKIVTLGPGDLPGTFSHNGLAITLYDHARRPTHAFPLFALPFLNLPFAAMGGYLGGLIARAWLRMEKKI